ncbi:MAG: sugar transferase [Armatimonadetes bacterium]|nr:sugar transferase [Armatimonadota bacterium]MCA1996802.1 sugar transferase [Armatimonadota bacterium]
MALRGFQLAIKRLADVVFSALVLAALSPLLLLIALGIKLASPGPVFYRQRRLGLNGRPFGIFKFRTMHPNAPVLRNPDGSMYTGADDPRVFPLGRVLRKLSLDELPQFLNVLLGDMSVVGPRPDPVGFEELYEGDERDKLGLRPGITGWAMVNGRNSIPWKKRVELDAWYVRHYSLWLDAKIFLMTIPLVLLGRGVHQQSSATEGRGA